VSGKTARRDRRRRADESVRLIPADAKFSAILADMMGEAGIDYETCTKSQVHTTMAICCKEFERCWDELVLWVVHGEDERAKTLEIVHALGGRYT
jgi:hypothetical protein